MLKKDQIGYDLVSTYLKKSLLLFKPRIEVFLFYNFSTEKFFTSTGATKNSSNFAIKFVK